MAHGAGEAMSENGKKKRWTPEQLQELRDHRAANTASATAERYDISEQRMRQLLTPAKKQIKPRTVWDV
jgi:hypothetical protein